MHCLFFLISDFVLDVKGTVSNLAEGSLNAFPGLSLFPLALICIFPNCSKRACSFCVSGSSFLGDKFFGLFLTFCGGQIGDLCKPCFGHCWRKKSVYQCDAVLRPQGNITSIQLLYINTYYIKILQGME